MANYLTTCHLAPHRLRVSFRTQPEPTPTIRCQLEREQKRARPTGIPGLMAAVRNTLAMAFVVATTTRVEDAKVGVSAHPAVKGTYHTNININGVEYTTISDGRYTVDPVAMAPHKTGNLSSGKSQFVSSVDAETAVIDAAKYADEHNLWSDGRAKVGVVDGPIGFSGLDGSPLSNINVYRRGSEDRGYRIHGSPGN